MREKAQMGAMPKAGRRLRPEGPPAGPLARPGQAKACLNAAPPLALRPFVLLYSLQFIWYFYPEGKLGRNSAKNIPIFKDFKPIIC